MKPEESQDQERPSITYRRRRDWLSANVIISLFCFLIIQFGTSIWWASKMTAELAFVREMIIERTNDRYTKTDAAKDLAARDVLINANLRRLERVEGTVYRTKPAKED